MTATGRLSRSIYPKWLTTRSIEISSSSVIEEGAERATSVSLLSSSREDDSSTISSTHTMSKLRDLFKTSVSSVSRQMLSSQTARPNKKTTNQGHSIMAGQSFADAMSECHSSVNQYYGVVPSESSSLVKEDECTSKVTSKSDKRLATLASKKAKILEAKHNRLSVTDSERKMTALTLNALAPGISIVSRMTRLRELCQHVKINPSSRVIPIKVGYVDIRCVVSMLEVL